MGVISIVIGIINQLVTGGAPPCTFSQHQLDDFNSSLVSPCCCWAAAPPSPWEDFRRWEDLGTSSNCGGQWPVAMGVSHFQLWDVEFDILRGSIWLWNFPSLIPEAFTSKQVSSFFFFPNVDSLIWRFVDHVVMLDLILGPVVLGCPADSLGLRFSIHSLFTQLLRKKRYKNTPDQERTIPYQSIS